ncbi:MAG TPA: hypothetical protein VFA04_17455 [Bryobacteraceae bacterium]|nr:hypothetical protein [Bryobacteraceae bacterium]
MLNPAISRKRWSALAPVVAALLAAAATPAQNVFTFPTNSSTVAPDTPASTLLVPYFEVDLGNPNGMNTIFTINNSGSDSFRTFNGGPPHTDQQGPTAILAHVVIWSDLGVPVFNFNVYLTGFDVERVNMRNVLNGLLPQTASAGQDPADTISPRSFISQDINFASCANPANTPVLFNSSSQLPPRPLTAAQIAHIQNSLTGRPTASVSGKCAGLNHGDLVARGYITVDTVSNCTSKTPADPGYIGPGGTGDMTDQTQLTGEVYYYNPSQNIAYGGDVVHVHVAPTDPAAGFANKSYTFYGDYDGFNGADDRQPLATNFTARFLSGSLASPAGGGAGGTDERSLRVAPPPGSTSLIVWRDPKVVQTYFTCGVLPSWYPLGQEGITAFDEQEHPTTITGVTPFGAATQLVKIGGASLPVMPLSGSLYLDLNTTVTGQSANLADPAAAQAWVEVVEQDGLKLLNVQHRAQQLDSANQAIHVFPELF